MAPRNNDSNPGYSKKKNYPVENNDNDADVKDILPCLLHKKHKVVKLVKSQMQKIQEEGLFCNNQGQDTEIFIVQDGEGKNLRAGTSPGPQRLRREGEMGDLNEDNRNKGIYLCLYILGFILSALLLIFIAVWVSAGPLSNSMAHTPIPSGSFVTTDGLCSLERKYLLRWSKHDH